ncbi:abortive infection family protein [Burkholderia sp. GS2Y]|uniref:Abortive infection family protein n=1 Tax=Burkholderia theae TaxID=3143496 RepID=A0ABU9WIP3_9BURK
MSREFISKATRNEFREVLVGSTLREIDMFFEAGGLSPKAGYEPPVGGQRRSSVETYYANIDFSSPADTRKLLVTYEEIIEDLQRAQDAAPNDKLRATINSLLRHMERDGFRYENGHFTSDSLTAAIVHAPTLVRLTEESIQEHVEKARHKIANGDAAGAIANAYTLVEEFLKQLLRKTGTAFNESEGDIRALYKAVATPLHLDPKGDSLENYIKTILEGLQRQIAGLFEVANKASDRHARRYNPAPHHAKLAVNAAFTLCEFLLESFEYQQKKNQRRAS